MRASRTIAAAIVVAAFAGMGATPSSAQNNPWANFFGNLIQGAMVDNAVKKWNAVDPDVRQCLANTYGLNAGALAQQAITPDDYRLQNQMQYCSNQVAQVRYQQEQQERRRRQAITAAQNAWNALDPQLRQCVSDRGLNADQLAQNGIGPDDMSLNGAVQSCRDQIAQAEQARLRAEARHRDLVARFGSDEAADIEAGRVTVGMSKAAVLEARGRKPDHKDIIPPDDEMWVYDNERISISKGKVTYVAR
ncbi:MAG: hypothetical protein KGJ78_18280 [Alphaproteobacteria bacterium]|nr:hypothetical protein [Alphaproteobacteria bacterium]